MAKKLKVAFIIFLGLAAFSVLAYFIAHLHFDLLDPKGAIALEERSVMIKALLLMLCVAISMFCFLAFTIWKYRAGNTKNKKADYKPDHEGGSRILSLLWAIPAVVILLIGILNWKTTHDLDPFKPIQSNTPPITIQVVSLQWKWLFIYPAEHIATVNFVEFPAGAPVNFELTSDAPMNSFWIPQLGGQMYSMAGMSTQLHLIADNPGDFNGKAAEISGAGFAGMRFVARAATNADFDAWVQSVKQSPNSLDFASYQKLAAQSSDNPPAFYALAVPDLYTRVMMKYMSPTDITETNGSGAAMQGMDMQR